MSEPTVHLFPVIDGLAVHNLHHQPLIVLPVTSLGHLGDNLLAMYILFQREEYLMRIDWLDEIIGYLGSNRLVHDILLLALCHHHHGRGGRNLLDTLQGFQSCESRHHLIEQDKVERTLPTLFYRIGSVAHRHHLITFLFQEDDVRAQQFYLIVHP